MFAPAASIARQGNIVDFNDYKRTHGAQAPIKVKIH